MKKSNGLLLALIAMVVLFFNSCETNVDNSGALIEINENISESVTWSADNVYLVDGMVYVDDGAVLVIEPGTTIKFNSGSGLVFGYSNNSTILAKGTKEKPITFTSSSSNPTAGAWDGLTFYSNTLQNSEFRNCIIEYAGSNNYGAVELLGCNIIMDSCFIRNSSSDGVYTSYSDNQGGFVSFKHDTISDCSKYAIEMDANKISCIDTSSAFINAAGILITGDYESNTPQTWNNLDLPYIIDHELYVDGTLTMQAGTTFKFEANSSLVFGYSSSTTLVADGGSSLTPITFTSNAVMPTAGAWEGITFYSNCLASSKMAFCMINYAGNGNYAAMELYGASINFNNNTIENSSSGGIYFNDEAGAVSFKNNTINTCANHLISISAQHLPDLGTPNTLVPAALKGIEIWGNPTYNNAVTWKKQANVDFYTEDYIYIDGDLTIEAGSTIRFGSDGGLSIGYSNSSKLTAVGNVAKPITFTSSAASPAAGAWGGLYFWENTLSNTKMDHCIIEYAGQGSNAPVETDASITVSNTQINSSNNIALKQQGVTVSGSGNNFVWTNK